MWWKSFCCKLVLFISLNYHSQANEELDCLVCEDNEKFTLISGHKLTRPIIKAQKDGPIIYGQDKEGYLYSFEQMDPDKNELLRTKIFRFPILGWLYNNFVDQSNRFQLTTDHAGKVVPWAVAWKYYTPDVRTITVIEMIQSNPIRLRDRDPWLPPWNIYEHAGPMGITGVSVAAGCETIVVFGYDKSGEAIMAYKRMTFDLCGSNPMMTYELSSGYRYGPSWLIKKFGEFIGVPQEVTNIPVTNWRKVILEADHLPYARVAEEGQKIIVAKRSGGASIFDASKHTWGRDIADFVFPQNIEWPKFEVPDTSSYQPKKAILNGEKGTFTPTTLEPMLGNFTSESTKAVYSLYSYSHGIVETLFNWKKVYDENGQPVQLEILK